jgi:Sel1 repeat/Adipocyte plasma membrane-associated protein-like, N-terminal
MRQGIVRCRVGRSPTTYRFATAEQTILPANRARVFFDGVFAEPRLQHPEGVAVGPDGWIWCGTENGEVLRIDPTGARIERMAKAGGFTLGLAFLGSAALFFCDNREAAVFRLDLTSGRVDRFVGRSIRIPNYPAVNRRPPRQRHRGRAGSGCRGPLVPGGRRSGRPEAQFALATLYAEGGGVPRDLGEAARWYRAAADQDNPWAQHQLAESSNFS